MTTRTLTEAIADDVRQRSKAGSYPGGRLPSENQLVDLYQASRGTVRRALAILVNEGTLLRQPGVGYSVRRVQPIDFRVDTFEHLRHRRDIDPAADAWEAAVRAVGRHPDQLVEVAIIQPPPLVAEALGTPSGEMVAVRRRLRTVDNEPYMTADSYYPVDIAQGTAIMREGNIRIPGGLMADAGHRQVRYLDRITARPPTDEEMRRLDIPPGTGVAEYRRTGFNVDDRPVRHIVTIAPGDRVRLVYEVSAE